jgi:hypothetical protein
MRRRQLVVAGGLALLAAGPAAAQEFRLTGDLFGQKKPAPAPPKVDWNARPSADLDAPPQPKVVCGMTVVPADPKHDPAMARQPKDTGVKYTLKVIEPTVCAPTQR